MFKKRKKKKAEEKERLAGTESAAEEPVKQQQGVKMTLGEDAFLTLKIGNSLHPGAREYQEDAFGYSAITDSDIVSEKGFVAVLADGMGGLSNGADISKYVVSSFIAMWGGIDYGAAFPPQLESIATKINDEVCKNFCADGKSGAGSTLVAAFVHQARLHWICIGDSRLYILREGMLYAANEDHDYFNQLLCDCLDGEMSMEEIFAESQKDSLTSYIGNEKLPFVDANEKGFPLQKGDALILCSDGIYNGISDAEMIRLLRENEPQKAAESIAAHVLEQNLAGQDNLTVMVINFE